MQVKRPANPHSRRGPAKARAGAWEMELRLSRSDLEAMPDDLRHRLLAYLESGDGAAASAVPDAPLDKQQVTALLREISFHRHGRSLRALLDRLAYDDRTNPPNRRKLAEALPRADRPQLGRYVALLNRLAAKATKRRKLRLCRFQRDEDSYSVHPATRRWLRQLLPAIERAGQQEEPLWE